MRQKIFLAAFAALATLAITSEPAGAGQPGWSAGHWSLPAGARFSMSRPGMGFRTGGFGGRHFDNGAMLGGRFRHNGFPGRNRHGPVFITPSFGQPVFVIPNPGFRVFGSRSVLGVRQFDPVRRTVVIARFGDQARFFVGTVPVPCFKPWPWGRWHGPFGSD